MNKQLVTVIVLIVAGVAAEQFPAVEKGFLIPMTEQHPHLETLAQGIVGALMAWYASRAGKLEKKP